MLATVVNKTDEALALVKPTFWKGTGMWRQPGENRHILLVVGKGMKRNKQGEELESFALYEVVMAGFLEEVTVKQRPEGREGVSTVRVQGNSVAGRGDGRSPDTS